MKKLLYSLSLIWFSLGCNQSTKRTTQQEAESPKDAQIAHCAPKANDKDWYTAGTKAPKFKGLEGIDFKITTKNKEAQDYFNQGMMLSYGFNHAEAARSFFEATRLDSTCAMCYWGYSYVLGPNYNGGMEPDNFERAYIAVQKAHSLANNCTAKEQQLIEALMQRYAEKPPKDRKSLDIAYSTALKKVYKKFSTDPEVSALYAESLMDLHPWDLYVKSTRKPKPWTPEILSVLENLIRINPRHPAAPHFYIHAVEGSEHPERGLASAKLLSTLVPGSGHLLHMPSHIYIWTGDYHLGSLANIAAVKVDSDYVTACHAQGAYPLVYYPHNYHFLSATATLEGNSKWAWMAAKKMQENTAQDIMKQPGWGSLQHYYTIPYYVAVKFAMWDTILATPTPEASLVYPRAVLHYARGMAYLGKNELINADKELVALTKLSKDSTLKDLTIWDINNADDLVQIAVKVLSAKVLHRKHQTEKAVVFLKEAIAIEDHLNYNEPPDWFFSVRHYLGSVLIDAAKYADAEKVYVEDLKTFAENGWALIGLHTALTKQGKAGEAHTVKQRFDKAWKYADIKISSSIL